MALAKTEWKQNRKEIMFNERAELYQKMFLDNSEGKLDIMLVVLCIKMWNWANPV